MGDCCVRDGRPDPPSNGADGLRRSDATYEPEETAMQHSIDRILTTHAGSIPRGEALGAMLIDQEQGKPVDQARLNELADARVAHVLASPRTPSSRSWSSSMWQH